MVAGALALWPGNKSNGWQILGEKKNIGTAVQQVAHAVRFDKPQVLNVYGNLPLQFEPNVGQSDSEVKFLARGQNYGLFLTADKVVLALINRQPSELRTDSREGRKQTVVAMELVGANHRSKIFGRDLLPSKTNYLLGNDPRHWHTDVPQYAKVVYQHIYPGVDLVYYGRQRELEYDFVVAPGADVRQLQFRVRGAQKLTLNRAGDLTMHLPSGQVLLRQPHVYQTAGHGQQAVPAKYVVEGDGRIRFDVASYDHRRALVIDPQVSYATYLGGSGDDTAASVAVDTSFNAYVAGTTTSSNFPLKNALPGTSFNASGATDVFVTKFNSAGSGILFSTYLGGSGSDSAAGIAVDAGFHMFVSGTTASSNFPVHNAYQATPKAAGNHVFVTEINSSGTGILYSTYLSGSSADTASGVAAGQVLGSVYVTGTTASSDFPHSTGALQTSLPTGAASAFFASKLDTTKSGALSLIYSTFLGGSGPCNTPASPSSPSSETAGGGIAVDGAGNAYVTGGTTCVSNFPITSAKQPTAAGGFEAFVTKLNNTGTKALYSTFLGGTGDDIGYGIAVDSFANACVTGSTTSADFPVQSPAQAAFGGGTLDAFVTKLSAGGSVAYYSTYLGGSGDDRGRAIAADSFGNVYVTGSTAGSFPVGVGPGTVIPQSTAGGGLDAFVTSFNTAGGYLYSTYLGGSGDDEATGIAVDTLSSPYIAGNTTGSFPVASGAFQSSFGGGTHDAFLGRLLNVADLGVSALSTPTSPATLGIGNPASFQYTITNAGHDLAAGVSLTATLQAGSTFNEAIPSQGTCGAATGSPQTVFCNVGFIVDGGTATVTVNATPAVTGAFANSAVVSSSSVDPDLTNNSAATNVTVTDFAVAASAPASSTVAAGSPASYTIAVSSLPPGVSFPNQVGLSCVPKSMPAGTSCLFSTALITPNTTSATTALVISTTAPPTTTAKLHRGWIFALSLPLLGMVFLRTGGRTRRIGPYLVTLMVVALAILQLGCGSSSKPSTSSVTPTPPGTYHITVQAASGSFTRTTHVTLVVQ